ncbi:MAG: hypothetical protein ABSH22_14730 [Tepidisphaeraceae bacterium]
MVASKREKQIAIAVAAVIGSYILYEVAEAEYFDPMDAIANQIEIDRKATEDNNLVYRRKNELNKVWMDMQTHGLKSDETAADSQLGSALDIWSSESGLDGPADLRLNPEHTEGKFPVISYTVTVQGSTKAISKLLWALETTTIPIRVTNMMITPQPEGSDHLQAHIEVSTLAMPPELNNSAKPATTQSSGQFAGGTSRPANAVAAVNASPVQVNGSTTRPSNTAAPTTQPINTAAPTTTPTNSAGVTQ